VLRALVADVLKLVPFPKYKEKKINK